jgi:hypothetical protein
MPDIVKILYNGRDAFAPQTTPFIGLNYDTISYGGRWGVTEEFVLEGLLTGCTYEKILEARNLLSNNFNKSYQSLEIWQEEGGISGRIFEKNLVEIQSINFSESNWLGVLPYTINLRCYPSGLFSGVYGVIEPNDSWNFSEQGDAVLNAVHTISCRGLNTSNANSNALVNARNWAFGKTGINSTVYPMFISGVSPENFCLISQTENIDRFNGTYSIVETYTNDLARTGYGVIRYTTTLESGNNVISVNLNGYAEGCGQNITGLRYAFSRIDKLAVATKAYQSVFNRTDLNPEPLTANFVEDPFQTRIDFSYSYDNSDLPSVWFDYNVDLSVGTNGVITAAINGTVNARGGDLASKLTRTQAYASGVNLYNLVVPFYTNWDASSTVPLNPTPISQGKGINQSNGTVTLNATYTNQEVVSDLLEKFEYSINFLPSREQVDSKPTVNGMGTYSVVDLGYANRAAVSIRGIAIVKKDANAALGLLAVRQKCFSLFTQYGRYTNAVLDENNITLSRLDDRVISFGFAWSFDSPFIIGPSTVTALTV